MQPRTKKVLLRAGYQLDLLNSVVDFVTVSGTRLSNKRSDQKTTIVSARSIIDNLVHDVTINIAMIYRLIV